MGVLLNRRRYMGGEKGLPYDAEIEYLESTGTQWINTLVNQKETQQYLSVAVGIKVPVLETGEHDIAGSGSGNTPTMGYSRAQYFLWAGSGTTWNPKSADTSWHDNIYTFLFDGGRTFSEDGSVIQGNQRNTFNNGAYNSLYLFASSPNRLPLKCKLKYASITIDGVLRFDAIPVRVGTTGYLYDKISGQLFGNVGTGNFILGADKAPESYDAEIEYLESTGTQYIDTDINCGLSTSLIVDGNYTEFMNDVNFGSIVSSGGYKRFHFGLYNGKFIFGVGDQFNNTITQDLARHLFELNGAGYAKFDNTQITLAAYASTYKRIVLYLFARNRDGTADTFSKFKLYGCRITENDIIVRDFIPVRAGTVGYMYDKVSGKLFGNNGTGSFTIGPDKT